MKLTQDTTEGMLRHVAELQQEGEKAIAEDTMCTLLIGVIWEDGDKHRINTTIDSNGDFARACLTELLKHYTRLAVGILPPQGEVTEDQLKETMQ